MSQNSWAAVPQSVRDRLKQVVFERDGWRCQLRLEGCTGVAEEPDHIVPRSRGGAVTDVRNMQASCRSCNRKKGAGGRRRVYPGPSREW